MRIREDLDIVVLLGVCLMEKSLMSRRWYSRIDLILTSYLCEILSIGPQLIVIVFLQPVI